MGVFTSTIANSLKLTLDRIVDDKLDNVEASAVFTKWTEQRPMSDAYEDDLEMGGPGLASEKAEGSEMQTGDIKEGVLTRYIARTFALRLQVTEEAMEDTKYPRVISAARRLKKSMWKTADIDAALMLVRGYNAAYTYGDGLPLWSDSHTLPQGGTFSNTMATPVTPSRTALITATSIVRKYPGHDGITEGYEPKAILCPTEQWGAWDGIVGSKMNPDDDNFNEINVVYPLQLKVIPNKFWNNTTTNWAITTDCENGFTFRWRRRPRSNSWVVNDQTVMWYAQTARWSRGISDPRCTLGVEI